MAIGQTAMLKQLEADDWKVLDFLKRNSILERSQGPDVGLSEAETARSIFRLTKYYPPLINRLGETTRYQLSMEGRKLLRVEFPPSVNQINVDVQPTPQIEPGPRGQLVRLLKNKPHSVADLARLTGLELHQVHWFLKTLEARGLMGSPERSKEDGRIVLYRLKSTPIEPAAPVLTPALIPLNDPYDWRTWMQRLLVEREGGDKVVVESSDKFIQQTIASLSLPRVLIIGVLLGRADSLKSRFSKRLELTFFDDYSLGKTGNLRYKLRSIDRVFLCVERCRHDHFYIIRDNAKEKMTLVNGGLTSLTNALEAYCK